MFRLSIVFCWFSIAAIAAPQASLEYLDQNGGQWLQNRNCISCHSGWSYGFARIGTENWETSPVRQLENHIHGRLNQWDTASPWYGSRTSTKGRESFATEIILSTSLLVEMDRSRGQTASSWTKMAVERLFDLQNSDGGLSWLNFSLQPLESSESRVFGNSLAMVSIAKSGLLGRYPSSENRLKGYLRTQGRKSSTALYYRLAIAWASSLAPDILADYEVSKTVDEVLALQNSDGGFSLNHLGPWSKRGSFTESAAAHSDANATSYAVLLLNDILKTSAEPDRLHALKNARNWLVRNQKNNGSWQGISVNSDRSRPHGFMTDLATAMAVKSLNH